MQVHLAKDYATFEATMRGPQLVRTATKRCHVRSRFLLCSVRFMAYGQVFLQPRLRMVRRMSGPPFAGRALSNKTMLKTCCSRNRNCVGPL